MTIYSENSESVTQITETPLPPMARSLSWRVATNLLASFKYAWQGIAYAFRTQRNFRIHVGVGTVAVSLAIALSLAPVEIAVIILTCGAVLTMELINTALESVVDLTVQQTYHELAKIAKDCAAAAVLISALLSLSVAVCLLLPPLWQLVQVQVGQVQLWDMLS
ncbi:MAG: diacylglycerol kinase family protein [Leptolyngbya sp. LCM1.Bin17]|nr:MAG: diacylglycerol kinase family protein [Leptolyngbya sp. LCM1.Bin17]